MNINSLLRAFCAIVSVFFILGSVQTATAQAVPGVAGGQEDAQAETSAPEALDALLEVLRDDAARAALIAELESSMQASEMQASEEPASAEPPQSLGRRIAQITQEAGEEGARVVSTVWTAIRSGGTVFDGLKGDELSILVSALPGLLVVIVITVATFLVLRRFARRLYARMGKRAENSGPLRSVVLFLESNLTDVFIVIFAWALGYLVTITLVGQFGQIGIRQSMYLNAFLIVELARVVIRAVLSPAAPGLRLVPFSDGAARALTRYLSMVVSVLGYGQLLIVPIVNQSASMAAGNGISAMLSVFVLVYLVYIVLRRRREVAQWLERRTRTYDLPDVEAEELGIVPEKTTRQGFLVRLLRGVAGIWHWFALAYLSVMFLIVMTQPAERTIAAISGSAKIVFAIILATLLSGVLARAIGRGISLPEDLTAKLPLLETRINRFVPRAFGLVRLALLFLVLFFSLDVIGLADVRGWMESQVGIFVTAKIISVGLIFLVAFMLWLALTSFVDYKLNPEYGAVPTARETTLLTLLRNAATIALVVLTAMFCLSEIGLDIGPLLASAGVLGLAIGFGAQKMVQDIITGIFIQFENAINVGDVITVGGITGAVEKLSVRSVSLRDVHGVFHIIPFSSVDMVSNFMRGFSYFVCDMGIAYRENVQEAKEAMHEAFDLLIEDKEIARDILGPLEWFGVNSFGDSAVVLRARIKTVPGKQWGTGRAYNGHLKEIFDARGIEIPFPQQTIWFGEAKDGTTQPVRIKRPEEPGDTSASGQE
ncbi:mechanosensitive ion channel domain-containing protein [Roseobacter ponti]|uniref:Mechanosensitive ion channel n=1 Tax=Roseobacter ponti TaxID=1891787 RepID=A0A858SRU9_9RHOB|nr:mechanosensitive ion channel domain-containing protein [Roseobacter ponti]QJF51434.1 mechanosensitive ion channel [Roseobacter ponti]